MLCVKWSCISVSRVSYNNVKGCRMDDLIAQGGVLEKGIKGCGFDNLVTQLVVQ